MRVVRGSAPFNSSSVTRLTLPRHKDMPEKLVCVGAEGVETVKVLYNARERPVDRVRLVAEKLEKELQPDDLDFLRQQYLLIGTPCYGNTMTVPYSQSITQVQMVFLLLQIPMNLVHIGTESLIPRGRNGICAEFMGGTYTHLLFIDADIGGFGASDVIRMMLLRKPVLSAIYPLKRLNLDRIRGLVRQGGAEHLNDHQLLSLTNSYVYNQLPSAKVEDGGIVRVLDLPTGFMMLQKGAMERIRHLSEAYVNDVDAYDTPNSKGEFRNYFGCMVDKESGRYLSEDYAISRRFQEAGVDTYAIMNVTLSHSGTYTWNGRVGDAIVMSQPPFAREQLIKAMRL